ncbi:baseplate J/gp47 family protein [uncultured Roseobacter sp.]|uniref:baseplate J/gp47 family protein n=1 Tax=uncultured Roseobacter sp. TaxID=114847 RepID=UPI002631C317|nr:baseplate J/gp47 family protein [uncultured Roseobacter sp.]
MSDARLMDGSTDQVTRTRRYLAPLEADFFVPDERSPATIINYLSGFSRLLTYFDAENRAHPPPQPGSPATGAWQSFLCHDVTFLLAEIAAVDAEREYRESLADETDTARMTALSVQRLANWRARAQKLAEGASETDVEAALEKTFTWVDDNEMKGALPFGTGQQFARTSVVVPELWVSQTRTSRTSDHIDFSAINRVTAQLVAVSKQYLERSLTEKSDHALAPGLLLTFVKLFQKNQADLNRMTDRHLSFYYRDVLRSAPKPAAPDSTHLVLTPAAGARPEVLPEGTAFKLAGGAGDGPVYASTRSLTVSQARVSRCKAITIARDPSFDGPGGRPYINGLSVFPVVNSQDGRGAPFDDPEAGWSPFGPRLHHLAQSQDFAADIGFALAAHALDLRGGHRHVTVSLWIAPGPRNGLPAVLDRYRRAVARHYELDLNPARFTAFLSDAFCLSVSTAAGFLPVPDVRIAQDPDDPDCLRLSFSLSPDDPALTPISGTPGAPDLPLLKIAFNPRARCYAFSAFGGSKLTRLSIDVVVRDLRALTLETDLAPVAPGKPFAPFGPLPLPGASFFVSAPELQNRSPTTLGLQLAWEALPVPPDDFKSHYQGYGEEIDNHSFTASLDLRDRRGWQSVKIVGQDPDAKPDPEGAALFQPGKAGQGLAEATTWRIAPQHRETAEIQPRPAWQGKPPGTLAVTLQTPAMGFGHTLYPTLLAQAAAFRMRDALGALIGKKPLRQIPKPPLLPTVAGVSLSYTDRVQTDRFSTDDPVGFYRLSPHGQLTHRADGEIASARMDADGYLMIGLDQAKPPEEISLFFQMRESEAEHWTRESGTEKPGIAWFYRTSQGWRPLPEANVLSDGTMGLTTYGVVDLALPVDMLASTLYSPEPLRWLSIQLRGPRSRYGRIVAISVNGVRVTRQGSAPGTHAPVSRPAGSITKLRAPNAAVATVTQPMPTTGGIPPEDQRAHRTRVCDRLHHKARAIRTQDIGRMVLEAFPRLADVTCRTRSDGRVDVIVAATRTGETPAQLPLVPLHIRQEVSRWLRTRAMPSVQGFNVINPSFEPVVLRARVAVKPGAGLPSIAEVSRAATRIMSPWRDSPDLPLPIGADRIVVADLERQLSELDWIDRIYGLSLVHHYTYDAFPAQRGTLHGLKDSARLADAATDAGSPILRGATPASVLILDDRHDVSFLPYRSGLGDLAIGEDLWATPPQDVALRHHDANSIPSAPVPAGIGNMQVGRDLVITTDLDVQTLATRTHADLHHLETSLFDQLGSFQP